MRQNLTIAQYRERDERRAEQVRAAKARARERYAAAGGGTLTISLGREAWLALDRLSQIHGGRQAAVEQALCRAD